MRYLVVWCSRRTSEAVAARVMVILRGDVGEVGEVGEGWVAQGGPTYEGAVHSAL